MPHHQRYSGNSGIGFTLAELLLADEKNHVIITSRDRKKGQDALLRLQKKKLPGAVDLVELEVSDPASIEKLSETLTENYGR